MAPEILNKEQEQTQQQEQQREQEITKIISELESSNILVNVYDNYRVAIYDPHGEKETQEVMRYLVNTTMYKYLYNIVKAYAIAIFLHPKKVKNLISNLIQKLEAKRIEDIQLPTNKFIKEKEKLIYYIFDDEIFFTTLLTQLLYKRNNKLISYLKMYYYYKVTEVVEDADFAVTYFYVEIIKNILNLDEEEEEKNMPELIRYLDYYDTGAKTFKIEDILKELKEELNAKNDEEIRNIILNEIKTMLKNEKFDKQFIKKLKKEYRNKGLVKTYIMLKKLVKIDEYNLIELETETNIKIKEKLELDNHKKEQLKAAIQNYLKTVKYFNKAYKLEKYFTTYIHTKLDHETFEKRLKNYLREINLVKKGIFKYLAQQPQ